MLAPMFVPAASQLESLEASRSVHPSPKPPYDYVDGGFYYRVALSARGREFVSLPGLSATQVQELVKKEGISFFPPKNFDGNESFAFTHGWQIGSNKVGIVAEDGVLSCTVYDEAGGIIHDEEIPQHDSDGRPLPAGEIYCFYTQRTPFIQPDGKVKFLILPTKGDDALLTWKWDEKELSLTENENGLMWQLFDKKSNTTSWTAFKNAEFYRPKKQYYLIKFGRFFSQFPGATAVDSDLDQIMFLDTFDRWKSPLFPARLINKVIESKIGMLIEMLSDFTLDKITLDGNQLQSLQLSPHFTGSRLDPNVLIDKDNCAITLINSGSDWHGHAQLIVEIMKKQQYYMYVGHLRGLKICGLKKKIEPGIVNWHKIVLNKLQFREKAVTHSLSKEDTERIVQSINEETKMQRKGDTAVFFDARGEGKLFRTKMIQTDKGPRPVHNCITWARDKLLLVGIQLATDEYSLYTTPRKYTKPNARYFV